MKKFLSLILILALACGLVFVFASCNETADKSKVDAENRRISAETFAENYIATLTKLTYDVSSASASGSASSRGTNEWSVRGTVYATGTNGLRYSGSFSAVVEYDEASDKFDIVDYDIGKLTRN